MESHKKTLLNDILILELSLSNKWEEVLSLVKKQNPLLLLKDSSSGKSLSGFLGTLLKNNKLDNELLEIKNKIQNNKSQIIFSKKEISLISELCENSSRLEMGQINAWLEFVKNRASFEEQIYAYIDSNSPSLVNVRNNFFKLSSSSYYSILSESMGQNAKISFDIYQVIRQYLAFENSPEGGILVVFDNPLRSSKENLIEIINTKTHFKIKEIN